MRRLFYSLFIFCTLLIVFSELKEKKQILDSSSFCQSFDLNRCNDFLVITINSTIKPILEFTVFNFTDEKLLQNAYNQKMRLSLTRHRLFQSDSIDLKIIRQDFLVSLHYTSETEEYHHHS